MSTITTTITPEKVNQAIEGIKREASALVIGATTNNHHSIHDHNSKAKLEWMNRELDNLSSLVEIMKHCSDPHVVNKVLQQILNRCKEIRKEWMPTSTHENHNNGFPQDKLSNNKPAPPGTHNLEDQTKQQVFVVRPLSKDERQKALDACGSEEERKVEQDHQEWDDEIMKLQKTVDEKIARMHNKRTGKRVVSPFLSQEVKTRDTSSSIVAPSARPSETEPSPSPASWRKSLPSPLDSPPASTFSLDVATSTESTPSMKMVEPSDSPSECKSAPDQTYRKAPLSASVSPRHPREEERSSPPKGSSSKGAIRKGSLGGSMLIFRSNREERIVLDDATEKQLDALSEVQLGTFINKALQEGTTIAKLLSSGPLDTAVLNTKLREMVRNAKSGADLMKSNPKRDEILGQCKEVLLVARGFLINPEDSPKKIEFVKVMVKLVQSLKQEQRRIEATA